MELLQRKNKKSNQCPPATSTSDLENTETFYFMSSDEYSDNSVGMTEHEQEPEDRDSSESTLEPEKDSGDISFCEMIRRTWIPLSEIIKPLLLAWTVFTIFMYTVYYMMRSHSSGAKTVLPDDTVHPDPTILLYFLLLLSACFARGLVLFLHYETKIQ